jgi:hypothetical protein
MDALLVTVVFALGGAGQAAQGKGAAAAETDGKWLIVYAEEGGRRNNTWEQRQATLANGTLTYEGDGGKHVSFRLKFAPHQMVNATGGREDEKGKGADGGKAWHGVYILGQDYLCLSLTKGAGKPGAVAPVGRLPVPKAEPAVGAGGPQSSSGELILILRRQRGGKAGAP